MDYTKIDALWRAAGGSFHGPHTETAYIEKSKLLPFLDRLISALKPFAAESEMFENDDDGVRLFAIDEDQEKSEIDICVGDLRRAHAAINP